MTSHLRLQASFEPVSANATYQTSPTLPPAKKQKMSLTQTYYVASTARSKLGKEANRADHNLRLLVGHANLLDGLMVQLADAEREQESWFHASVKQASASKPASEPRHIQWIDTISEEEDEDDSDAESDDSDVYDEDAEMFDMMPTIRKLRSPPVTISSTEIEEDDEEYDEEDDDDHVLTRVASRHSPPELTHDDSDSEDESMPTSPESEPAMHFSEKERQTITTTGFYDVKSQQGLEDYIIQQAQQPQTLIAAY